MIGVIVAGVLAGELVAASLNATDIGIGVGTALILVLKWIDDNRKHKATDKKVEEVKEQVKASNGTPTAKIVEEVKANVTEVSSNVSIGTDLVRDLRSTLANHLQESAREREQIKRDLAIQAKHTDGQFKELRSDIAAVARQVGESLTHKPKSGTNSTSQRQPRKRI